MDESTRELPFSTAEYHSRLGKVQQEMQRKEMDLLMSFWPENIYYLTGYHTLGYFGFQTLLVPSRGDPVLVVRAIDRQGALDLSWMGQCHVYQDSENPLDVILQVLRDGGWAGRRLGVELDAWFLTTRHFMGLCERLGKSQPVDGSQIINRVRLIKSEQELAYMRSAARAAEVSMQAVLEAVRPGVKESAVAAEMHRALFLAGSEYLGHPPLFGSGRRTARAFITWSDQVIQNNVPIHVEPGGCIKRYHANFVRTLHLGTPKDKTFLQLADLSIKGLNDAIAAIRVGVTCAEIDDIIKAPARKAGFGHFVTTRGGYSIGIGFPPDWGEGRTLSIKQGDPTALQENMTFHLLSNVWYEDRALICFSDNVRVTNAEAEVLTKFRRELIIQ